MSSERDVFEDPITLEQMEEAMIAPCGHSFSRASIVEWLSTHNTCPVCNAEISEDRLSPNYSLREAIARLDLSDNEDERNQAHPPSIVVQRPNDNHSDQPNEEEDSVNGNDEVEDNEVEAMEARARSVRSDSGDDSQRRNAAQLLGGVEGESGGDEMMAEEVVLVQLDDEDEAEFFVSPFIASVPLDRDVLREKPIHSWSSLEVSAWMNDTIDFLPGDCNRIASVNGARLVCMSAKDMKELFSISSGKSRQLHHLVQQAKEISCEEQEKCGKPLTVEEFTAAQADALRELGVDIDLESGAPAKGMDPIHGSYDTCGASFKQCDCISWCCIECDRVRNEPRACMCYECHNGRVCLCADRCDSCCHRFSPTKYWCHYTMTHHTTYKCRSFWGFCCWLWILLSILVVLIEGFVYLLAIIVVGLLIVLVVLAFGGAMTR